VKVSDIERVGELLVELKARSETLTFYRQLVSDLGGNLRIDVCVGSHGPEGDLTENYRLVSPDHLNLSPLAGFVEEMLLHRVSGVSKQLNALGVNVDG
jgi:hypothetical protein